MLFFIRIKNATGKLAMFSVLAMVLTGLAGSSAANAEVARPEIVDRQTWKAAAPNPQLLKSQSPRAIIIHHTSVKQQPKLSLERKLLGLQSFSMRPGKVGKRNKPAWGDMPYHFYIGVSGRIGEGLALNFAGDTNTGYDTVGYVQVVVEGDFEKEKPTAAQLVALDSLVVWLAQELKVAPDAITAHNDHASTDCPGRHLKSYLDTIRANVANAAAAAN